MNWRPSTPRVIAFFVILTGLCLLPSAIKLARYPDYPGSDDAFIHLSIVENIHRGYGWGINPHEPVFLSTSPLFTVFFTAIRYFASNVMEVGMALSAMASALYVLGVFALARRLTGQTAWGMIGAALAATNIHLWRWNGTFMEVIFATAAVVWLAYGFLCIQDAPDRRRPLLFFLLGIGLATSLLLRPELGLLLPAFLFHSLANDRRRLVSNYAAMGAGLAVVLLPFLILLRLYFGYMLPTTLAAKTSPCIMWMNFPVWAQLFKATTSGCLGSLIMLFLTVALFVARLSTANFRKMAATSLLVWLFPLLGFCFYSLKMPGLQSAARYYLPFMALIPAAAAVAGTALARDYRRGIPLALALCALQLAAAWNWNERLIRPVMTGMMTGYVATMREAAAQIGARANSGEAVLAYVDIGVVAKARPPGIRILDGGCLASPEFMGLSLPAMIRAGQPRFVLESLGTEERLVERSLLDSGIDARPVWSRRFRSHSVEHALNTYEARLFELKGAR